MAEPKSKTSKGKRNKRRSHHAITPVKTVVCKKCGKQKKSHRKCPSCNEYK